jgi:hypothetical protein
MKTTTRKRKATKSRRRTRKTSTAQFLQDNAGTALRRGRDTMSRAYDWAHEAAGSAHLPSLRMPRRQDLSHLTEANPLLLGAVGLGLGVAIATLFPRGMHRVAADNGSPAANGSVRTVKARSRRRRKARVSKAAAS